MDLTWFRRPADDRPGTLNLCYNAVDLQVVRGAAEQVAVRNDAREVDFATLLEQVSALAGAMRSMGVGPGSLVAVALEEPYDVLLAGLAAWRLGGVVSPTPTAGTSTTSPAALAVVDRGGVAATVRIHRGLPVEDDTCEVDWDVALRAGRTDPAPCADVPGDAPAYLADGVVVAAQDALGHPAWLSRACATLATGQILDPADGAA